MKFRLRPGFGVHWSRKRGAARRGGGGAAGRGGGAASCANRRSGFTAILAEGHRVDIADEILTDVKF